MADVEFSEDVFESMLNGSFEESGVEEEEAEIADESETDSEHQEDTDLKDEDVDDNTDDTDDGEYDEDEVDEEVEEEEDALVEDYDLDDEDDATEDEVEEDETEADEAEVETDETEDKYIDDESEDSTDTEEVSDGAPQETDTIDYKAFYDQVVNTEFTVNGRKSKGFADPKKIIQSMQMAGGFSEKMAGFKQYRPFMAPLKERGMLEDQAKFDLAMNIIDGDKEAIKTHLSSIGVDPLDLDMEAINYEAKAAAATPEALVVDDAIERAKTGGYEDRLRDTIGKQWDTESFNEFVANPQVREDLLNHMESGDIVKVEDKMAELSRLDYNGSFASMSSINRYRAAVKQLQAEAPTVAPQAPTKVVEESIKNSDSSAKIKEERAKIAEARKEAAYKKKVASKNAKVAKERKKAASMSRKKTSTPKKVQKFDPLKAEGKELDDLMEFLISGGR